MKTKTKYICKYCGRTFDASWHEPQCKYNPNRVDPKHKFPPLTDSELWLLGHYYHLYKTKYIDLLEKHKLNYSRDECKYYDIITLSKRDTLQDLIQMDAVIQEQKGTPQCPICGLHMVDMRAHITKVHNIDWETFVTQYSWDKPAVFFSEHHCASLSANKNHFYYETTEGEQWREHQKEVMAGEANIACRDDVRLKISDKSKGRKITAKGKAAVSKNTTCGLHSDNARSWGYTFWTMYNGKECKFRSKSEYSIFLLFRYYNMDVEFEPYKLEYIDPNVEYPRHYLVDFVYQNRLFESKTSLEEFETEEKYIYIQSMLNQTGKTLELLTLNNFYDVLNIDKNARIPISKIDGWILDNIKNGICKVREPVSRNECDFYGRGFLSKLGPDAKEIVEEGKLIYENKKNI